MKKTITDEMLQAAIETSRPLIKEIGAALVTVDNGSRALATTWINIYPVHVNVKTGSADIGDFVDRVFANFPELHTPQEKNPNKYRSYGTVIKEGAAVHSAQLVQDCRVFVNMRAWLAKHIDELVVDEVPLIGADEKPVIDEATGLPVTVKKAHFGSLVTDDAKKLNGLLSAIDKILKSSLLTEAEIASARAVLEPVAKRLRPMAAIEKEELAENVKTRYADDMPETGEETDEKPVAEQVAA